MIKMDLLLEYQYQKEQFQKFIIFYENSRNFKKWSNNINVPLLFIFRKIIKWIKKRITKKISPRDIFISIKNFVIKLKVRINNYNDY
jgi:hypothetical protein